MAALSFDPATHQYSINGTRIPSVTQILREAGLVDYDGIPEHVLKYAADRSTAVHLACEYFDADDLDLDSVDPIIQPYMNAYYKFSLEHPRKIIASEQMYIGELNGLRFGMRLDRVIQFEDDIHRTILDIKCTREIHDHHGVQLAGYACGLYVGLDDPPAEQRLLFYNRMVLQLRPDSSYELHEFTDTSDGEIFAAALKISYWKRWDRLQ